MPLKYKFKTKKEVPAEQSVFVHGTRRRGGFSMRKARSRNRSSTSFSANLKAFFPLPFDIKDAAPLANHGFSYSGVTFTGPTPVGFKYPITANFNGSGSQMRLENTTYPFGLPRWTAMCWFRKTGAGATTVTSGGTDGFPSRSSVISWRSGRSQEAGCGSCRREVHRRGASR